MEQIAGIKYTNSGSYHYVRVDLDMYENNDLLQDFLDSLEIKVRKGEKTISLDEFNKYIDKRLEVNV
jgi:hypothetical protein